jgi:hypothetical protein
MERPANMKPREETFAKLDEFCRYPWFQNCGKPLDGNYALVRGWGDVKKQVRSERWEMLQGYFHHYGFVDPLQKGPRRGQKIREIFVDAELRNNLHQLLFSIHQKVERYDWPSGLDGFGPITQSVQRDLAHALWEAEYSDMAPPTKFSQTVQSIYREGHFVAGWEGSFPRRDGRDPDGWLPDGRLRVF